MRVPVAVREGFLILALGALLAGSFPGQAEGQVSRRRWDTVKFSRTLGSLSYVEKRVHAASTHGVTAIYRGDDRVATISAYDRGLAEVPADLTAGIVRDELAQSCRDLESGLRDGTFRTVVLRDSSQVTVRLPWREMEFLRATYDLELAETPTEPAKRVTTHIFLTVMDGVFARERYTHPAEAADPMEVQKAMADFAGILALRYLGDDWSTVDDFRRAEPVVRRIAQWLVDDLRYPPDELRAQAAAYAATWITRNPYLQAPVDTGHLALAMKDGDCECEDYVEIMYIIGCGLHKMDEPGASPVAARLAGMEFALDAQARLAATGGKLTGCAALTPLISARKSGTLAAMLEE
ncbi:MAG: hypothetical protein IPJ24_03965 [bacterium]|nr:hypothetical protein [bacterium]